MTWVVKAWKPDAFDARLAALEQLGTELRDDVRRHRSEPEPEPEITVRRGRATMHDSPLTELFKATEPRFARSGAYAAGARSRR